MSVVVASTTPQPDQAQAVREAVLAGAPELQVLSAVPAGDDAEGAL